MKIPIKFITTVFLAFSYHSSASTTIAVANIDGLFDRKKEGQYDEVLTAIKKQGPDFTVIHVPPGRTFNSFYSKKVNCLAPTDLKNNDFPFPVIESEAINLSKAYVFWFDKNTATPSLTDIKGLRVGARSGMIYGKEFESLDIKRKNVTTIESNYKKLITHRIDVFVAFTPDIWSLFKNRTIPSVDYDKQQPFVTYKDSVVCHDTPENRLFIEKFNKTIFRLKESGVIKKILGISYIPN